MIKIPVNMKDDAQEAVKYLEKEIDRGTASYHIDGKFLMVSFYYHEDETAFVLKFGKEFQPFADTGYFYCPYIPTGFK